MKSLSQITRLAFSTVIGAVFVSCSSLKTTETSSGKEYLLTLNLTADDTREKVLQRYGGTLLSFNPQAGFAILKTDRLPVSNDTAIKHLEPNIKLETTDARIGVDQPNIVTQGATTGSASVGMSGWNTWSSGWNTWSSGWNTWSSGQTLPSIQAHTNNAYMSSRVPQAHKIARKFGAGVIVAVLDTGIDLTHPGFAGRLIDSSKRWNFVNNNHNVAEMNNGVGYGHGTAVAGVILQVAPKATIMPLKVLDSNGKGDLDHVVAAIDYAVNNGARVINISLGSTEYSQALWTVINHAIANNVFVVAAVGNGGQKNAATYPGAMGYWWDAGKMIGVGSINNNDQVSSFSNSGDDVFMYAPGDNVPTYAPDNRTATATGTSFATPLVAGAMALAYGETQNTTIQPVSQSLYHSNDRTRVWWRNYAEADTSVTCTTPNNEWCFGQGTLDVERLLLSIPGFVPANHQSKVEMVRNGGFELASFQGWTSIMALSNQMPFAGANNAQFLTKGSLSQKLTGLLPNTNYRLTAWVAVDDSTESVRFQVRNFGRTNVSVRTTTEHYWYYKPISLTFTTGSSSTSADLVIDRAIGLSAVYIDSVSVTQVW